MPQPHSMDLQLPQQAEGSDAHLVRVTVGVGVWNRARARVRVRVGVGVGVRVRGSGLGLEAAALAVGEEGLLALLRAGEERRQGGPRLRVLRVEADDAAQVGERLLLLLQV